MAVMSLSRVAMAVMHLIKKEAFQIATLLWILYRLGIQKVD
jgi:hypothetical protein